MQLQKRVVLLTGATQGIGLATAQALAAAGCQLALVARSAEPLQALVTSLSAAGGQAIALPADVADTSQAAALVEKTVTAFGQLDILVNNAGIGVRDRVSDLAESDARRVMEVNYFGPLALIQAAIPALKANPDGGLILNVSSVVGRRSMPGIAAYCASKSALEGLADSLRVELKRDKIRVCTVHPGATVTQFNVRSLGQNQVGRDRRRGVPPERVAQTIRHAIQNEPRDAFVTLGDRLFVGVSALFPKLVDKLLTIYDARTFR